MDKVTSMEIREDDWRRMQYHAAHLFHAGVCVCGLGGPSGEDPVFEYVAAPDGMAFLSSPQSRPGELFASAFPKKEGKRLAALLSAAIREGSEIPETEVSHGKGRYSSLRAAPLSPGRTYVVFLDKTSEHATEAMARLSDDKLAKAFRLSPDAIIISRLSDGVLLEVNAGFSAMTGWPAGELLGQAYPERVWGSEEDRLLVVSSLRETGYVNNLAVTLTTSSGTYLDALISAVTMDVDGLPAVLSVIRDISRLKSDERALLSSQKRLEDTVQDAFELMGRVVEVRDPYTRGHQERVSRIAMEVGKKLGLPDEDIELLRTASLVHDIGKLKVPAEILSKPGPLDAEEWALIRRHADQGYLILKDATFAEPLLEMVRNHHERLDGSGYPRGLSGDEIPLLTRILAVADVAEAMSAHRPYRATLGVEAALEELSSHPELYDAVVVQAFGAVMGQPGLMTA